MTAFHTSRLPRQPGPAGWNRILPPPAAARVLAGRVCADVAILGAGFAGLSAARRLQQIDPQLRVVILEAGRVGDGPAGRNSGFMIDLPHDLASDSYAGAAADADRQQTLMNRRAIDFARAAAQELGMPKAVFDPSGKVNGAASEAGDRHNRDYARHLDTLDESYRLYDAADMQRLTGSDYYRSGLYTPGTVLLQPAAYIRALADGITATNGTRVKLFENSPVVSLSNIEGGWSLQTAAGSVSAGRMIMAANGHAESFGLFRHRLLHVFTYASMTEPISPVRIGGEASWGLTPADPMGTTIRRIRCKEGDRLVVRTRFTYNPSMQVTDHQVASIGRVHDRKLVERFPTLKGIVMAYRWGGHLCLSWNGVPAHGEVEPGLYAAVCQNGLGTTKGTLAGMSAAELAAGRSSSVTDYLTSMDAPRRLPPASLTAIGVGSTLRWKEWRAGRE